MAQEFIKLRRVFILQSLPRIVISLVWLISLVEALNCRMAVLSDEHKLVKTISAEEIKGDKELLVELNHDA